MTLGLVCDACDALSPLGATVCGGCGEPLGTAPVHLASPSPIPAGGVAPEDIRAGSAAAPASASRCVACGTDRIAGHRFCGVCGLRLDDPQPSDPISLSSSGPVARTQFFGAMQAPGRAKLILIKGEGMDGISYHLAGTEHVAGRREGEILFPDDPLLSPRHANFFYRGGELLVRDEASHNGVFIRIKAPVVLESGGAFLVGEQLMSLAACPNDAVPIPDSEGTYFYGSPKRSARMCVIQRLVGGDPGIVVRARSESISIGREGNDINFPDDPFISGHHAQVTALDASRFQLSDVGSKNGTFLRVDGEAALRHGDYVFLGQQLLRVEIT